MLSFIVPVYNGGKYLKTAVESIINQPCKDLEIIIINDGSIDCSGNIADQLAKNETRITVIHDSNHGVSHARNLGIEIAIGEYIAFLDADDALCLGAFNDYINFVLNTKDYDILSFSYFTADQNLRRGNRMSVEPGEKECDELKLDVFKHFCSCIYHNRLLKGNEAASFNEAIKYGEDLVFHFLANRNGKTIFEMDHDWFCYRNNITSAMHKLQSYDYIIEHEIPAWYWCKKQCQIEEDRSFCDTIIIALASEFIRYSCLIGFPIEQIKKGIDIQPVQEAFQNHDKLWKTSLDVFKDFKSDSLAYWKMCRKKGAFLRFSRRIKSLPLIRRFYMRIKYKENIEMIC